MSLLAYEFAEFSPVLSLSILSSLEAIIDEEAVQSTMEFLVFCCMRMCVGFVCERVSLCVVQDDHCSGVGHSLM